MNIARCTLDFETKSACSLKKSGVWRYSTDKSTEVLCLVWRLPYWEPGRTALWHPSFPSFGLDEHLDLNAFDDLVNWITDGGLVEAHNSWFEFSIWRNVMVARYGWPEIPLESWRCSAAKAAAHALPRGLADAVTALKLPIKKDAEGSKVMLKMTKPRKSRKKERETWAKEGIKPPKYLWHESKELLDRLIAYCRLDVLAEEGVSAALPDLCPQELEVFQMDLRINLRGFQLDKKAVRTALRLLKQETTILNRELTKLTKRKVRKATQRARMMAWFGENGLKLFDTQKATLDEVIATDGASAFTDLTPDVRRGVEIVRALGRSSTAKYTAMRNWITRDGRVRGGMLYHGASTGRWAGKGVQPHNFPKGTQKVDMTALWATLLQEDRDVIAAAYRSVMEALSNGLRGAITAGSRKELFVADYAAIEARGLLWLANDQPSLAIFRQGRDIYLEMAADIYGHPCTKEAHPAERSCAKIAVLGLGYGMGASKFQATCEQFGVLIDEDFAKHVVDTYRDRFCMVKRLWEAQEAAATKAAQTKKAVPCGKVTWFIQGRFLYCRLPSGRCLAYPYPEIKSREMPWGGSKDALTYMGIDGYTHQWRRQTTYGGMIVENLVQAISRDLMAEAMLRVENDSPYDLVLSVHDELVAEAPTGTGTVHSFEQLLTQCPKWAQGLPVAAEGFSTFRYRK